MPCFPAVEALRSCSTSGISTLKAIAFAASSRSDIRSAEDFRQAHIIEAVHTDENKSDKTHFERYKAKPIIIACQRGIKSAQFALKAKQQGCNNVYVLAGGIQGWLEAELPLIKGK